MPEQTNAYCSFADVAQKYAVDPDTVQRGCRVGVITPRGRVRLAAIKIGGVHRTTWAADQDFIDALNPTVDAQPLPRSPAHRRRARERAAQRLKAIGV